MASIPKRKPRGELWDRITGTMPQDSSGHLSQETYRDIVAYILRANGLPAGHEEFPSDRNVLKNIVLKK
jgi:hypothetical protein